MEIVIAAQDNKLYRMEPAAQGLDQGNPVHALHFDIGKHDLGSVALAEGKGLLPAGAGPYLADHRAGQQLDLLFQSFANIVFIIYNQDIVHGILPYQIFLSGCAGRPKSPCFLMPLTGMLTVIVVPRCSLLRMVSPAFCP